MFQHNSSSFTVNAGTSAFWFRFVLVMAPVAYFSSQVSSAILSWFALASAYLMVIGIYKATDIPIKVSATTYAKAVKRTGYCLFGIGFGLLLLPLSLAGSHALGIALGLQYDNAVLNALGGAGLSSGLMITLWSAFEWFNAKDSVSAIEAERADAAQHASAKARISSFR